MARSRQFSESDAVDAAAGLFRRQGYSATSVDDLVGATGVHRASLYGVFGSKYGFFVRVLDQALNMCAAGEDANGDLERATDIILIGLLELAPSDNAIRLRLADVVGHPPLSAALLGERLLSRSGCTTNETEGQS